MIRFLTTLKQKDLSAVSAEQCLSVSDEKGRLQSVDKYKIYDVHAKVYHPMIIDAIKTSYIFSNPNKHHF